jgi:hypothetical protein
MVDSYLYGWMIVQFHIPGYSQLLSKYSRNVLNLSYAEFYNCLYEIIKTDQIFGPMYKELQRIVSTYLYTGEIVTEDASLRGHALHHFASKQIYNNRERIVDLVGKFVDISDNIKDLQRCFIANKSNNNSIIIDSEYDIDTWARKPIVYQVDTKIPYNENFDFWNHRRRGLLKNKFTIIERTS